MKGKKQKRFFRIVAVFLAVAFVVGLFSVYPVFPVQAASAEPYDGCVWISLPGHYETSDTLKNQILEEVNRIRYEACSEGLINPDTGVAMTTADYTPVQWSSNLETVSLLRAAEATQLIGHVRPCSGGSPLNLTYSDYPIRPNYECLAWNWSGMMAGINQWYGEKSAYVENPVYDGNTGHYVAMIDPTVRYIGFSSYYSTAGTYRYNIAGEFSMTTSAQDNTFLAASEPDNASVSVKKSFISTISVSDTETHPVMDQLWPGETTQLRADASYAFSYNGRSYSGSGQLTAGGTWESSDPNVATVTESGLVSAVSPGTTVISCAVGSVRGEWTLTVDGITTTAAMDAVTTASGTAPVLPETVSASWLLGGTTTEGITWDSPLPETYKKRAGGTYTVTGTLTKYPAIGVMVTVNVTKASVSSVTGYAKTLVTESGTPPEFSPTATVLWSNGDQETVDITWPTLEREHYSQRNGGTLTAEGTIRVYVSQEIATYEYLDIILTCTVTVKPARIISVTDPEPMQTFTGHRPTGLPEKVSVQWSNGDETEENVSWTTISTSSYAQAGSFTVTGVVDNTSMKASQTINVVDPKVTGIRWIEGKIPRSTYIEGQDLELSDVMFIADFEDGSTENVPTTDLIITGYDPYKIGSQSVKFNYERDGMHSQTLAVMVREKRLSDVVWDTYPTKLAYVEGQALDISGGKVKLIYDNDTFEYEDVDNAMLPGVTILEWTGSYDVTFIYHDTITDADFECPFSVTVEERNPASLTVTSSPSKTEYVEGDSVDLAGGMLQILYNDGTTENISMTAGNVKVSPVTNTPGQQTVRVYVLTTDEEEVAVEFTVSFREKRMVEAASSEVIWGSGKDYEITCQDADLLQEILLDGQALPAGAYTVEDGRITLTDAFLRTLSYGNHLITLSWEDETQTMGFSSAWPFTDVKVRPDNWAYDGILYVYSHGIMTGDADRDGDGYTTFNPKGEIIRGEFITTLYRMDGEKAVEGNMPFTDVKANKFYYHSILWAYHNGITTGTGATTFSPKDNITRQDMAVLMMRFANYMGYDTGKRENIRNMPDYAKVKSYARDAFSWANAEGIITGKEINGQKYLDPRANATRQECATIIMRFMKRYVGE